MTDKEIISRAEDHIRELLREDFSGHDFDHAMRVKEKALFIQRHEGGDGLVITLASLLHDVDDYKLFPENKGHENLMRFLDGVDLGEEKKDQIIKIIDEISYKSDDTIVPSSLEGKIVQDADRLDAIGAIGIARAFAYGGSMHRRLYDFSERPILHMTGEEYQNRETSTLTHFYEKLLHLKDLMNTETGRHMAESRHEFMKRYLQQFLDELNLAGD